MQFQLETERLLLRVLTPEYAEQTLAFYQKNADIFEKYEPIDGEIFYTLNHQRRLLAAEYKEMLRHHLLRFWIFEKGNDDAPIGTINFYDIKPHPFAVTSVGYKMDRDFIGKGYCYEALSAGMEHAAKELGMHRFEAIVLPDNAPSMHLLEKLGFQREGLLKEKVYLQGTWRDHFLYSYVVSDRPPTS